ncbi:MAG: trypsin-like peptidase domain-containing protein [Chloroflexi bacterium]|nr:trypsin-like peptidase domain-containing protein [Chloroflexota bacterium]MYK60441.1 trypsin-like peptidase domain-containing protein [Chloroflexota bacterium]
MITSNVIFRVFHVRVGGITGTAFAIENGSKEYLVTARHVVEHLVGINTIRLFQNSDWQAVQVTTVGHSDGDVDISVLGPEKPITTPNSRFALPANSEGITYGQDVYFLGFPLGINASILAHDESKFRPLPLVKRATLSMFPSDLLNFYLLDGHNNRGFSGGPVVFRPSPNADFQVAAVVSAYQIEEEPVLHSTGAETGLHLQTNTGLIHAYDIKEAIKLIDANPIGCDL